MSDAAWTILAQVIVAVLGGGVVVAVIQSRMAPKIRAEAENVEASVGQPDYFHIRKMERELGLPLTPFPDWFTGLVLPQSIASDLGIGPVLSWPQLAELYESGVFDHLLREDERA